MFTKNSSATLLTGQAFVGGSLCCYTEAVHEQLLARIDEQKALLPKGALDTALQKNLDDWYRVELTYTSNAIEGNTLTREEVAKILGVDLQKVEKVLKV